MTTKAGLTEEDKAIWDALIGMEQTNNLGMRFYDSEDDDQDAAWVAFRMRINDISEVENL